MKALVQKIYLRVAKFHLEERSPQIRFHYCWNLSYPALDKDIEKRKLEVVSGKGKI